MALDAATRQFLEASAGAPGLHELSPRDARRAVLGLKESIGPGPNMHRVSLHHVHEGDRVVGVLELQPSASPRGAIVYIHGGGWVLHRIDEYEAFGRTLARENDCTVFLVDYSLAPENPFPHGLDDAWEATRWVESRTRQYYGDDFPVLIAGDSSGGNLAAAVAIRGANTGLNLNGQILISPVLDCDLNTPSYVAADNQGSITRESMSWFWDQYIPDIAQRTNPEASPLRADVAGVPPAIITTAEHDVLLDEGRDYAYKLQDAGIPTLYAEFEGQMHGFITMLHLLPGSTRGMQFIREGIDELLAGNLSRKFKSKQPILKGE